MESNRSIRSGRSYSERIQSKVFTNWVNLKLKRRKTSAPQPPKFVSDIRRDLSDGVLLIYLSESLTKEYNTPPFTLKPSSRPEKLKNALKLLEVYSDKLKITVSSDQIVDGDLASILTLLWDLIVEFELSTEVEVDGDRHSEHYSKEDLREWVYSYVEKESSLTPSQRKEQYPRSLLDGVILGLILKSALSRKRDRRQQETGLGAVLLLAERELKVPLLFMEEDFTQGGECDDKSLITYLALLRSTVHKIEAARKKDIKPPPVDIDSYTRYTGPQMTGTIEVDEEDAQFKVQMDEKYRWDWKKQVLMEREKSKALSQRVSELEKEVATLKLENKALRKQGSGSSTHSSNKKSSNHDQQHRRAK